MIQAAEHVIGSVLCSPGCFSVYRCKAIRDVLPMYASNVEHAFEFLTKDMGEDRWFCTLLVGRPLYGTFFMDVACHLIVSGHIQFIMCTYFRTEFILF